MWHPSKYAEPLAAKMREHGSRVWLVNTGWSGGAYGAGKRMKLANTRAILDAIHNGALTGAKTVRDPVFGFDVVTECPGVPREILLPRESWSTRPPTTPRRRSWLVFSQRTLLLTKAASAQRLRPPAQHRESIAEPLHGSSLPEVSQFEVHL
jgi:Phosphoenolpyruvate carboxykinase